ncbi:MAG: VOC family protein [Pseudomonadota bacterium]|nr:VOC family protein [Pseudomonadota bacterium]MDQ3159427.1 VOC family protein [Pseudomonadota bacterium]
MFNHIMIGTNDIDRSEKFYNAVLGVLGAGGAMKSRSPSGHMRMFYRHDGNTFGVAEPIDGGPATCANGATFGFKCSSAEQAKEFHDVAVAAGGTSIEDPPGLRTGDLGSLYLAYVRDPDGNKLCSIYRPK